MAHEFDVNTFKLSAKQYPYEVDGVAQPKPHKQTDFVIDGGGLGTRFGFEDSRPWFGQTCFETAHGARDDLVAELRGMRPPENQFGTDRFVLYRCHCGCDYCGVISCEIQRTDQTVVWRDVRYEDEDAPDNEPMYDHVIIELEFATDEYDREIARYHENAT